MSGIVDLPHPVPVRYRPPRGRNARLALATVTTPVRLNEVAASEARPVGEFAHMPAHAHGDHLWTPLPESDVPALVASLAAIAGGPLAAETNFHGKLVNLVGRSPLVALTNEWLGAERLPEGRQRIVDDGTEQARADLVRYLDGNVLVVGGHPHARIRGPLLRVSISPHGTDLTSLPSTWTSAPAATVTTPVRAAAALAFEARRRPGTVRTPQKALPYGDIPLPATDGLDDVLHFVATAPVQVLRRLRRDARPAMRARLSALATRGMTGGVGLAEAPDAAEAISSELAWMLGNRPSSTDEGHPTLEHLLSFARGYVQPALDGMLAPEDAAALDGMAP